MPQRPIWRLLDSGAADGYTNMAIDEAMLLAVQEGRVPPTLRIYAWQPACLSIGTFQSVSSRHRHRGLRRARHRLGAAANRRAGDPARP